MKFLLLILAPLGDTLFTTPSLKALRTTYPAGVIDLICWDENKVIFLGNKNINRLISCKGKGQLLIELQKLRETTYDVALGLSTIGSYLTYLVNAREKIGFKGEELAWLYDYNPPDDRTIHAVDYSLRIVKQLGARPDQKPVLEISIGQEDYRQAEQKLKDLNYQKGYPIIAIHPGGKYFGNKRWPATRFRDLIKQLDLTYQAQIVLIGGRDDCKLAAEIVDPLYHYNKLPLNLTGSTNLQQSAAIIKKAVLFIGNDSAPLHLAAAAHIPSVALFGPTNPANFHPYGTDYQLVSLNLSCSPCFSWLGELKQYLPEVLPDWTSRCGDDCMEEIKVTDVLIAVEHLRQSSKLDRLVQRKNNDWLRGLKADENRLFYR